MIDKFEIELTKLKSVSGQDSSKFPLRWIEWESSYKGSDGLRCAPWRKSLGDIGYIVCSTHDQGVLVILCRNDGKCFRIRGYCVGSDGEEEMNYEQIGELYDNLKSTISSFSGIFSNLIEFSLSAPVREEVSTSERHRSFSNNLVSLPQPVLFLSQPSGSEENSSEKEQEKQEDDEKIIPFTKASSSEGEYWALHSKLKSLVDPERSADPTKNDLIELSNNPIFKEASGQRAVYTTGAIPAMRDILRLKPTHGFGELRQNQQVEAVLRIFAMISLNPLIRRHLANEEVVRILLDILKREEVSLMSDLLTTIANCCHNTSFREYFIEKQGIEQLIVFIKQQDLVAKVCYTLWSVNRSQRATQVMIDSHLSIELERYTNPCSATDEQMLNITRLLCSLPVYGPKIFEPLKAYHIKFFCIGLRSSNDECVSWSAKAFTVYPIDEELQRLFCGKPDAKTNDGPTSLRHMLDNKNTDVVLSGLDSVVVLGEIAMIRDALNPGIQSKLQNLWKSENPGIRKGVLKVIGVLTKNQAFLQWTVRQNLIPDLLSYLNSTDYEFVIYAAKAIGTCCNEAGNLSALMRLNGVRTLWSLMKSPVPGVQAAATRALVPFLKSSTSPPIVRTFVDGLELLVDLLRSNDAEVQESACMAVTQIAKDKENLAVMTDLGLVELLSRLLSTKQDSVRKPLADAIGVAADWSNNRRRFGEEGAVDPLVSYLRPPSSNKEVHAATAKALKALSEDAENSKKLSQAGVVEYLLIMVESEDPDLQMAAAVAIRNIRTNRA